ncbi:MAG: hypothetical protein KIT59_01065 [Nitrosomonas sp.]|nr:hypothetical protein [Nitrosomonas sp.]
MSITKPEKQMPELQTEEDQLITQEILIKSFDVLRSELKREYFWCKVKLNTYAAFLFGLILYFELGY